MLGASSSLNSLVCPNGHFHYKKSSFRIHRDSGKILVPTVWFFYLMGDLFEFRFSQHLFISSSSFCWDFLLLVFYKHRVSNERHGDLLLVSE